ncbi:hypothetical protein GIB67_030876 [Kingdonia uniflora]|uniref:Uncharacterized protein n=1 Tax=Kingdonia uniflora TaxID=39325 RepID=A0A7J7L3G1_9MAGN|nr:hypothetical protein GIB67_030876 [Kingdonia uniflora]
MLLIFFPTCLRFLSLLLFQSRRRGPLQVAVFSNFSFLIGSIAYCCSSSHRINMDHCAGSPHLCRKASRTLVCEGSKITADVAIYVMKNLLKKQNIIAIADVTISFFTLVRRREAD